MGKFWVVPLLHSASDIYMHIYIYTHTHIHLKSWRSCRRFITICTKSTTALGSRPAHRILNSTDAANRQCRILSGTKIKDIRLRRHFSVTEKCISCLRFNTAISNSRSFLQSQSAPRIPNSLFTALKSIHNSSYAFHSRLHLKLKAGNGIAQSVQRIATGWTVHGQNPGGGGEGRFSAPVQTCLEHTQPSVQLVPGSFPGG